MLKKIRIVSASSVILMMTLLFLDFTGVLHQWFGWLAKAQLVTAILAVNATTLVVLIIMTFLFGRLYCSVICPLGVLQDGISHLAAKCKSGKNRFRFTKAQSFLRYGMLALFVGGFITELRAIVSLLDPYASFGRLTTELFSLLYRLGNNLLARLAETVESYAFYEADVWMKSWTSLGVALVTLVLVGVLAWRGGRTYCNTICPLGTVLGFLSRFSLFRPEFDSEKCKGCTLCEKNCKASCIDSKHMTIDRSRCVVCFNCIDICKFGAMEYVPMGKGAAKTASLTPAVHLKNSVSRRNAVSLIGGMALAGVLWTMQAAKAAQPAQQLHLDGGLADLKDKLPPARQTPVIPPGAKSHQNMKAQCTACQLCVSACPNNILRPSSKLGAFMQPEISFERGFCRSECTECSQVCPAGAILKISPAQKSAISIGNAVWTRESCLVNSNNVQCNSCVRHCPTKAITLVDRDPEKSGSLKIPVIDKEECIGCGACEYYCPARPFSAIHVEGHIRHHAV